MSALKLAVAVIRDADGRMLVVRKRGTTAFMQPGGKIDPGETASAALLRELREELNADCAEADLRHIGRGQAPAANEPGLQVDAEIFAVALRQVPVPGAEIEAMAWCGCGSGELVLAPLTRDVISPMIGLLP